MNFCPSCGASAAATSYCPHCGGALAPRAPSLPPEPPSAAVPAGERPVTEGMAIVALLLNILIWPGLGSLVAGEQIGWAQGFLFLCGLPLVLIFIGIPMLIGAWVWGIVTGVQLIQRAGAQKQGLPTG